MIRRLLSPFKSKENDSEYTKKLKEEMNKGIFHIYIYIINISLI
jgi:hypothetical protein